MIPNLMEVGTFCIPSAVVRRTQDVLRNAGAYGKEAQALWVGEVESDEVFRIIDLVVPNQEATSTGIHVEANEINRIFDDLLTRSLILALQIHSHPCEAYHSYLDSEYPIISQTGALSVVVPRYAEDALDDMSHCAIYRMLERGWEGPLSPANICDLLRIEEYS